jgi:hypothetical protein
MDSKLLGSRCSSRSNRSRDPNELNCLTLGLFPSKLLKRVRSASTSSARTENTYSSTGPFATSINCYVDVKSTTHQTSFSLFLHDLCTSRPKRDLLLFVARHTAVTLTRNAPLFRAQSPGISVSRVEPSEVFFSPGSVYRRVVPWGDVSSWVKGAE